MLLWTLSQLGDRMALTVFGRFDPAPVYSVGIQARRRAPSGSAGASDALTARVNGLGRGGTQWRLSNSVVAVPARVDGETRLDHNRFGSTPAAWHARDLHA